MMMMEDASAREELPEEEIQEVEIAYTEHAVLEKLHAYGLKPKALFSNLKVNVKTLGQAEISENPQLNPFLSQLSSALKNWQSGHDLKTFTAKINQLIFLWLNAVQDGASAQGVLNFLSCFEFKTKLGISNSAKLHCFLFDMFAETNHQHQQFQLNYTRNFDAITQLPNANQILASIENAVKNKEGSPLVGLFSIHFQVAKHNPIFSQQLASELSRKVAFRLKKNISPDYQLYHTGNLQFDILIPSLSNDMQLNLLAAKLQRAFEQMVSIGNQSVLVTPFTGCAFTKKSSQKAHELYGCSKMALESAFSSQQQFVMYSQELEKQLAAQHDMELKVLEAFAGDSLTLFFQPIVNLSNSKCVGAELLLRWSDETDYYISPGLTIEILSKLGKSKLFTRWLINSACRYSSELLHEHHLKVYLTINLRAEDLYDIELPHLLLQALALWKIQPKDIILEVTENGILEENETTSAVINQLAESGFRLALDDFGTGFSSLSRLRNMPIDLIKIDQSFVRDISHSQHDFEIVKSIAMLANSLGKEVLAEGVEDKECLALIKKMKIHKCQGYFFAKPMPFDKFVTWAKQH
ncbi:MAG TPA: GGDEF domain-containing phosphodiesterase [Methylotenera sp.]|nr:GGDEF domain-containing phosphodiesterase [Methylotenera sp.]HPV44633.1 GGDEF domain-containing phosphodiesterase [Methylotenera sp.]